MNIYKGFSVIQNHKISDLLTSRKVITFFPKFEHTLGLTFCEAP